MRSNSNLVYALAGVTAIAIGFGVSFWRSAAENEELTQANLTAAVALEAAQDETKLMRERLQREAKLRESAEAAQAITEQSERALGEKLAAEARAKHAARMAAARARAALQAEVYEVCARTRRARQGGGGKVGCRERAERGETRRLPGTHWLARRRKTRVGKLNRPWMRQTPR